MGLLQGKSFKNKHCQIDAKSFFKTLLDPRGELKLVLHYRNRSLTHA